MKHHPTKKSDRRLPEWLAVHLDIPADLTDGGIRLDMRGRNTLIVHGCRRIMDYAPETIRLSLGDCVLVITGERLICTSYLAGAVGVEGCICAMAFDEPPTTTHGREVRS